MIDEGFYRAFEDRFRGSREMIESYLSVCLPFVLPLKAIYEKYRVVDLGGGRGEWIELMVENGFQAQGIDLDDGMIAACHAKGFLLEKEEAIFHCRNCRTKAWL